MTSLPQFLQRFQNLPSRIFAFHFADNFEYHAFFINHKSVTKDAPKLVTKHLLLAPNVVFVDDFFVCVRNQCEGQIIFGNKLLMRLFGVGTNTDHFETLAGERVVVISEIAGLSGAGGRVIRWIEIQDDLFSFQVF